jgi:FkbM family methyltransferase
MRLPSRPEYLWNPIQLIRRLQNKNISKPTLVKLAWGDPIWVHPNDYIGAYIRSRGIFDYHAAEMLARCIEPGDICFDVGANSGQMSCLMARCAGSSGRVIAFEPHPEVHEDLVKNVALWQKPGYADISTERIALSSENGTASLSVKPDFWENRGRSSLQNGNPSELNVQVTTCKLDKFCESIPKVGVMKVDVEGHELAVFHGAAAMLQSHAIRDIVFESNDAYPTDVTQYLEELGYQIFGIESSLFGIRLLEASGLNQNSKAHTTDLVATSDSDRLKSRFAQQRWQCFKIKKYADQKILRNP